MYLFSLAFGLPFLLGIGYYEVSQRGANPTVIAPWFWIVIVGVCAGFGLLATLGFSTDVAQSIEVDETGIRVQFARRERFYDWSDICPSDVVFPGSVRFSYTRGFHPFFLSLELTRVVLGLPYIPRWELPTRLRKRLGIQPE